MWWERNQKWATNCMPCPTTLEHSLEDTVRDCCCCCCCCCCCLSLCCPPPDTACCLNPYSQTYYNFDDHDVTEATAKQVKVKREGGREGGRVGKRGERKGGRGIMTLPCCTEWCWLLAVLHFPGAPPSQGKVLTSIICLFLIISGTNCVVSHSSQYSFWICIHSALCTIE